MATIYLSSTYEDLKDYREAAGRALRRLGHTVVGMEDYVAADVRPLAKCLQDVAKCGVYVGLFAWRYGYVPADDNPDRKSITELEYREATRLKKPRLIFLLSEDAPWLPRFFDKGEGALMLQTLRNELGKERLISSFNNPSELAELVGAAVTKWERDQPGGKATAEPGVPGNEALAAYLRWVCDQCAPLRLQAIDQGAARPGQRPLGLTSVYVDLNTEKRISKTATLAEALAAERQPASPGDQAGGPSSQAETRPVPALEALSVHPKLVLLGRPGSGKSTLTAYLALSLAQARLGEATLSDRLGPTWPQEPLLPIRVVLRKFAASLPAELQRGQARHLWDFLATELEGANLEPGTRNALRDTARTTGAFFLFDGLDEARDPATRARVLEAVAEFAAQAGRNCRFLLTSRPYAWEETAPVLAHQPDSVPPEALFTKYTLADFEPEQIQAFIQCWYPAIHALGWVTAPDARSKSAELLEAVKRADLQPLARSPLLLTLMATLHSNRAKLPDDRADLYNEVVQLLLERWNETIGADRGLMAVLDIPTLKLADIREVIEQLAFDAHRLHVGKEGPADIPEGDLQAALCPLLGQDRNKAALVIRYIEERAGLLLSQGPRDRQRQFTFPHRTFQEFLAACHLARSNNFSQQAQQLARENPAHWREVLTFAARQATASRGVPAADYLVHSQSVEDWQRKEPITPADWRSAILAGEQLLEIGLAAVNRRPEHIAMRDRVTSWLAAVVGQSNLPVRERAQAGIVLGKLGDPRPGIGLKDGLPDIEWVTIPAGRFKMGGKDVLNGGREFSCRLLEKQPYRISRYPITVAQFQAFVEAKGYEDERDFKEGGFWTDAGLAWRRREGVIGPEDFNPLFQTPNHPRVGVSWYEAAAYCRWLTERLQAPPEGRSRREEALTAGQGDGASLPRLLPGEEIRLPSEAEWERAARGESGRPYPWGAETDLAQRCNSLDTGIGHTSAVGLFPRGDTLCEAESKNGLADMAGNVWEWCRTQWLGEYQDYEQRVTDAFEGEHARVLRGASWDDDAPNNLLSCYRNFGHPVSRYDGLGFRVVWVSESAR